MSTDAAPPVLVVALIGLPGCGKTTVARALEARFSLQRVCRDAIRAAMFPDCRYTLAEKRAAFRAVQAALEVNCVLGRSSVLDGMTFSRHADLQAIDRVLRPYRARCLAIHLDCPADAARERIAADRCAHPAGDRSPELVDRVLARFDPPPASSAVIDARLPRSAVVAAAIALVEAAREGTDPGSDRHD